MENYYNTNFRLVHLLPLISALMLAYGKLWRKEAMSRRMLVIWPWNLELILSGWVSNKIKRNGSGQLQADDLTGRLMRHLGAMGYITEVAVDTYQPTNYSRALSLPAIGNGYLAM